MSRRCGGLGPYDYRCDRDVEHILDPDSTHRQGTATWPQRVYRQDTDGQVYLGFYTSPYGFVWDGLAGFIEVCHGGMAEPIVATIMSPLTYGPAHSAVAQSFTNMVERFHFACMTYIEEEEMD